MTNTINNDKKLINNIYEFLLSFNGITKEIIEMQLVPEERRIKPKNINDVYKAILESAQNTQMSPNVIGKAISGEKGNIDPIGIILFDFNPYKTYEKYYQYNPEEFYEKIIEPKFENKPTKRALWYRYVKTIVSAAKFLNNYKDINNFYSFIDEYYKNSMMRPFLPMLLSFEIDGFGFSLSCDFLKEMGYINYGKPDTHIQDIFIQLGYLNDVSKNSDKAKYYSLKIIDRIAESTNMNSYAVDKLLWLIGSGNFYLAEPKIDIGRQKKNFIEYIKNL